MAIQEPHESDEDRRLSGKNFTCVFCSQRFVEDDLKYQDDLESLPVCPYCFERSGGELRRAEMVADAAELATALTEKELRPPKEPGWFDSGTMVTINTFSDDPLVLTRAGASDTLTLTGIFTSSDTFTYDDANLTDASAAVISDEDSDGVYDQVVLTIQAGASAAAGMHDLTHTSGGYDDVYRNRIEVK